MDDKERQEILTAGFAAWWGVAFARERELNALSITVLRRQAIAAGVDLGTTPLVRGRNPRRDIVWSMIHIEMPMPTSESILAIYATTAALVRDVQP